MDEYAGLNVFERQDINYGYCVVFVSFNGKLIKGQNIQSNFVQVNETNFN